MPHRRAPALPTRTFSEFDKGAACPTAGTCFLDGFAAPNGGAEVTTVTNGAPGPGAVRQRQLRVVGAACSSDGTCWAVGWATTTNPRALRCS